MDQGEVMGIETAMLAATIGSGVLAAGGKMMEGKAAQASAESKANMLEAGATAQERRASEERAMSQRRAEDQDLETQRLMGKQRAISAASGGGTGGTAGLIEAETAGEGKFKSEMDLWSGDEKGKGLEFQAQIDRGAAKDSRRQGKAARTAGYMAAGSSILGSIGAGYKGSGGGGAQSGTYNNNKT
jgi:hypothetical protein